MSWARLDSLYARLLALVLAAVVIGGGMAVFASYRQALHEVDELLDAQLAQTAQTLLAIVAHGDDDVAGETGTAAHKSQQRMLFQVWHEHHGEWRLLLRSPNAPSEALPARQAEGFSSADWQGRNWRFYGQADPRRETHVVVGQESRIREELARSVAWRNLLPFLIGLPVLAVLLHFAIRRGVAPLRELAAALARRAPDRLEPVSMPDPPAELKPVLVALNRLFVSLEAALENERRFTSDASHELRTPLAALQAQLQVAGLATDEAERRSALEKCLQGTSRMTHLVRQLLTLARIEGDSESLVRVDTDLVAVVRSVCADLAPDVSAKDIALALEAPGRLVLAGQPDLLAVMARNLVENAVRYTPAGGRVEVTVREDPDVVILRVADNGPGVTEEQRASLGQRFGRFHEGGPEGVGLGLSIVRRIVENHGGLLEFAAGHGGRGLEVAVRLPKRASR
jgi:two-component system, OmpR family, sensor kinase